jgi:6-phosphogluconate dehydrogenase
MAGLGRMGNGLARRLARGDHRVVVQNRTQDKADTLADEEEGAEAATGLDDLVARLNTPRVVWTMLPAGKVTDEAVDALADLLDEGDLLIEGSNSNYKDSKRRAEKLSAKGIGFLDAGVSGGIWGLDEGFCLMVGGTEENFATAEPLFATLAQDEGYAHVGSVGAGHYVKMVHNGIEYGLLQAFGEGFEILEACDYDLDLSQVANVWRHGSVVRSWLLDLAANAYAKDPHLDKLTGYVEDSGEGRWTVAEAIDLDVPAPVITLSLQMRFRSRQEDTYTGKLISALRNEFGGHAIRDATGEGK